MKTQDIARKLVAYCRIGDFEGAQKELYANDVTSIEPEASEGFDKETKGLKNVFAKSKKFSDMTEKLHGVTTSEPLVTGNAIAFTLDMDITMKGQERSHLKELCVYEVKDGKVVSEQFFM
ncbi:MAG: nuclear transport factor 2 family protein [Agriterribacter sp.]